MIRWWGLWLTTVSEKDRMFGNLMQKTYVVVVAMPALEPVGMWDEDRTKQSYLLKHESYLVVRCIPYATLSHLHGVFWKLGLVA
jgi:hypothetical protein